VTVIVDGRRLQLNNLDKVMYPATGTTKGEVLNYYATVARFLLPHLADRPVTRIRWPHGTNGLSFFEKNRPSGAPSWQPGRRSRWQVLLEERQSVRAVRPADAGHRPVGEVREQEPGHRRVVVEHLTLGGPGRGVHDLVQ